MMAEYPMRNRSRCSSTSEPSLACRPGSRRPCSVLTATSGLPLGPASPRFCHLLWHSEIIFPRIAIILAVGRRRRFTCPSSRAEALRPECGCDVRHPSLGMV
jgi:hypothetical protein